MRNITTRPSIQDLSSSMDNYNTNVQESNTIGDLKAANVGVYFIRDELITKMSKN